MEDCHLGKQLKKLSTEPCPEHGRKTWKILISKAINTKLALGATDKTYRVFGDKKKKAEL